MKIRWNKESVRFRIAPSELEALGNGASISEELSFNGGFWRATIARGEKTALLQQGGALHLSLSSEDCARLSAPETEGVYFQEEDGPRYFIEKDFPCVHPRAEQTREESETFAPPPGFEERKL